MGDAIMVGMGEIKCTKRPDDVLIALGLGSCIAICAYDPESQIAAMAHVVLPECIDAGAQPGRFANTAVPGLLASLQERGATTVHTRIALAGAAKLLDCRGSGPQLELGDRNTEAVRTALKAAGLEIVGADLGGSAGRTVHLAGDGTVRVKRSARKESETFALGA